MTNFMVFATMIYIISPFIFLVSWNSTKTKIKNLCELIIIVFIGFGIGYMLMAGGIGVPLGECIWYPKGLNWYQEYTYILLAFLIYMFVLKPEWDDMVIYSRRYDKS